MSKLRRPASRYSTKDATLQVERAMSRSRPPLTNKEVADAIGVPYDQFSRKIHLKRSAFTAEEFGALADFFDAPAGWPFIPADVYLKR